MHIIDKKQSTLKATSYDNDNDEYMVDSELAVCDFDAVKEWYIKNKTPYANPNPKSNDELVVGNEESFFIEFKNGKIDNTVNFELNKKIYDSLFILFDLKYSDRQGRCMDSISYTRSCMNYILVYNEKRYSEAGPTRQTKEGLTRQKTEARPSAHRNRLYGMVRELANEQFILFGLDQFKNYLFKNVYTYTEQQFEEKFIKQATD